ncbi:MAG: TonB-dependent receptor plug domain-containing protein [Gemmatimonadaceae bacterium]|nr:TonB-dependent receptor plug domain-containing protein [Gemmatimonadaceae bacterium]
MRMRPSTIVLRAATLAVLGLNAPLVAQAAAVPGEPTRPTAAGASSSGARQDTVGPLQRRVSLDLRDVSLNDALKEINRQARLALSYTPRVVPVDRRVTLHADSITAGEALERVLRGTMVDVRVTTSGVVMLVRRTPTDSAKVDRTSRREQDGLVYGRVVDSVTARPIADAVVSVRGTALQAVTDDNGQYVLPHVPAGTQTIVTRHLGYMVAEKEMAVADSQRVRVDFALRMTMTRLQEIVTTATGPRRRMDLPNDVAVLNVDSLVATQPVTSVTDLLATRVPGLVVQHTSGAPGDPARLRLRGVSSISRGNDPIVIVDGVRVYYDQSGDRAQNLTGRGLGGAVAASPSPLDQLDVHSIETIEVMKGPSAATLYGADAANGVIVITTKKGRPGPARWRVSASQGLSYMPGRYPDQYLRFAHDNGGNAIICPLNPALTACGESAAGADSLVRFQALSDPALTVLRRGRSTSLSFGVDGGTSAFNYSLTGSYGDETGILKLPGAEADRFASIHGAPPPSWMRRPQTLTRWSGTGRVTAQLGPKADATFTTTLTRETQQRSSLESQLSALMSIYVDRSTQTYYQMRCASSFCLTQVSTLVPDFYRRATDAATNFTNAATVSWRPRAWLTTSADAGLNVIARTDEVLLPKGMLDTLGSLASARGNSVVSTANVRALATRSLPLGFTF